VIHQDSRLGPEQGLGNAAGLIKVYIEHRPPLDEYAELQGIVAIEKVTIDRIVVNGGNHWRKIFNVLAKLMYGLFPAGYSSWQAYRDSRLLTADDHLSLLFSAPDWVSFKGQTSPDRISIIAGKGYAAKWVKDLSHYWIDDCFAVIPELRLIVSPYLDYRQLSDRAIGRLQQLVTSI
jgi:hypothetical protein